MTSQAASPAVDLGPDADARIAGLRWANLALGFLHAAQALFIALLATDFALPVTGSFLTGPPGSGPGKLNVLFDVRIAYGVVAFLGISAIAHWLIFSPRIYRWYAANLRLGRNYARWMEYSLSASIMILLIAGLTGISDIAALVALFGVNASMILFGWLQERYESPGGGWLPFGFGCIAGIVPWIAIVIYVAAPGNPSDASPPAFVYAIIVSLFVFFNSFALNQFLQYKRVGRWRGYLTGESTYMVLSLLAKSALAWQVFAGALAT